MNRFTRRLITAGSSMVFHRLLRPVSAAIAISAAASLLVVSLANAQGPPQYLVTTMENDQGESFRPTDINDAGLVTLGKYSNPHLFVDVPNTPGLLKEINNLDGAMWIDLDTGEMWDETTPPTPWIADEARGINDSNQIVGNALNALDVNEPERVFVLENPLGPNPLFKLLPRFEGENVWGMAINDDGVVVGISAVGVVVLDPRTSPDPYTPVGIPVPVAANPHEINRHGDIVTSGGDGGLIISPVTLPDGSPATHPDGSLDYVDAAVHFYEGHQFYGINDSRQICGSRPSTGRGRDRQAGGTVRFQYDPNDEDRLVADALISDSTLPYFCDVNKHGDVAFDGNRAYVYLERLADPGPYALDLLVVFATPDDEAKWMASSRAQPNGINDQGQIIVRGSGSLGFFLTPISVTPDPGITATPDSNLVTTEAGGSDVFTVQLNTDPGGLVTVGVMSLDGSEGMPDVSSLTFDDSNWDTPQDVTLFGIQDSDVDGDQEYFIELAVIAAPAGSVYESVAPLLVGVTNVDDEVSSATLSVDGATIVEGDKPNNTPGQFTVTLSGSASGSVEISYQVSNGSAEKNRDYQMIDSTSGLLSFTAGETTKTVAFLILGDSRRESDETFTITLFDASGATITQGVGTVTILDDD